MQENFGTTCLKLLQVTLAYDANCNCDICNFKTFVVILEPQCSTKGGYQVILRLKLPTLWLLLALFTLRITGPQVLESWTKFRCSYVFECFDFGCGRSYLKYFKKYSQFNYKIKRKLYVFLATYDVGRKWQKNRRNNNIGLLKWNENDIRIIVCILRKSNYKVYSNP